jgi:Mn-containing catalase
MHQEQWLAVIEELGGAGAHPIPNSFPREQENQEFAYRYLAPVHDGQEPAQGRWSHGPSIDGHGEFTFARAEPHGEEPVLPKPIEEGFAQREQMSEAPADSPNLGGHTPPQKSGLVEKVKDAMP